MNGRYRNNSIQTKPNEETRVFSSTILPDFDRMNIEFTHVLVEYGDRLDLVAKRYYDDSTLWWIIARANNVSDFFVDSQTQLRIPRRNEVSRILRRLDQLNS